MTGRLKQRAAEAAMPLLLAKEGSIVDDTGKRSKQVIARGRFGRLDHKKSRNPPLRPGVAVRIRQPRLVSSAGRSGTAVRGGQCFEGALPGNQAGCVRPRL